MGYAKTFVDPKVVEFQVGTGTGLNDRTMYQPRRGLGRHQFHQRHDLRSRQRRHHDQ
jgi:hypothetical protein